MAPLYDQVHSHCRSRTYIVGQRLFLHMKECLGTTHTFSIVMFSSELPRGSCYMPIPCTLSKHLSYVFKETLVRLHLHCCALAGCSCRAYIEHNSLSTSITTYASVNRRHYLRICIVGTGVIYASEVFHLSFCSFPIRVLPIIIQSIKRGKRLF